MLQHGRKSVASVMKSGVRDLSWPPEAPTNLNVAAQRVWRETIANLSAEVLPKECYSLFGVWCSLKTELDDVMFGLAEFPSVPTCSEELKTYKTLLRMRTALTREFAQLSNTLRFTPAAHRNVSSVTSAKPWCATSATSESESESADKPFRSDAQARVGNGQPWSGANSASVVAGDEEPQP